MLEKTGRKAMDALGAIRGWSDGSGRLARKMGMRKSGMAAVKGRMPGTGWSIGLAAIAAAVGAALWMYFRKRRQVTDHYTMGDGMGGPWDPNGHPRSFETTDAYGS